MINPAAPISAISTFFTTRMTFDRPFVCFANVQYSISAGNARPSADKHSAPKREMNSSRFGIATANITANTKRMKNKMIEVRISRGDSAVLAIHTRDQHEQSAHNVFPNDLLRVHAEFALDVIVPCDIDGHVTGKAMRYKYTKCHDPFGQLGHSMEKK